MDCFKKFKCEYFFHQLKELPKVIFTRSFAVAIGLGQLLSLLICGTAVASGLLQNESVRIPTGQSFLTYVLLSATFTTWMCCVAGGNSIPKLLRDRGWKYFFLALIDVEANYMVVKAYQFTSVTSVQLLDCIAIPTVLILSWRLLNIRYGCSHLIGVFACILGASSLVLADHLTANNAPADSSNPLLGDVLVVCGAILYGLSNVGQELMVSGHGTIEYLGTYSFLASFISGIQFVILERQEVASVDFTSPSVFGPLIGFVLCLFLLVALMSYAMLKIGAMAVNLNLLSSDFFALLVGLFVFQYTFHALYFVSFFLIIFGLVIYNLWPPVSRAAAPLLTQMTADHVDQSAKQSTETVHTLVDSQSFNHDLDHSVVMLNTNRRRTGSGISDSEKTFQDANEISRKLGEVAVHCNQETVRQLISMSDKECSIDVTHL